MRLALLSIFTLLICISCGKDDEPQKEENCLTAVIDGGGFTAETTTGTFVVTSVDYENLGVQETKLLTINGTIPSLTGETTTISLSFACSEFTSDLDYVETDSGCGISMTYQVITDITDPTTDFIVVTATEGSINVEELSDDKIKGTFTFKGDDQNGTAYNITNGFFDTTIN